MSINLIITLLAPSSIMVEAPNIFKREIKDIEYTDTKEIE